MFFTVRLRIFGLSSDYAYMNINELYRAVRDGDETAQKTLFEALHDVFLIFAEHRIQEKEDAEDLVQDALATIVRKYKTIEFTTSFSAWAYRILEFKMMHYYRTKRHRRKLAENYRREETDPSLPPEDIELRRRLIECLRKINRVNPRYARILNLRYQGFSVSEMSGRLDTTPNNIYNLLSRARSLLKHCLERGE